VESGEKTPRRKGHASARASGSRPCGRKRMGWAWGRGGVRQRRGPAHGGGLGRGNPLARLSRRRRRLSGLLQPSVEPRATSPAARSLPPAHQTRRAPPPRSRPPPTAPSARRSCGALRAGGSARRPPAPLERPARGARAHHWRPQTTTRASRSPAPLPLGHGGVGDRRCNGSCREREPADAVR
jgi:hypothetical protein